ncbi:MAG: J domain-containing protein, partial [Deltaproteobacteria bacterium]|nr:J domain-containing protein [Deltaproteobacteria bacterium]
VPPPPAPVAAPAVRPRDASDELPSDERQLFQHLTAELRRIRQMAVHEVLGVDRDADPDAIRVGWMHLIRKHHPDLVARHQAPAITHLAEELTILCNRAYDRLRVALVAEGRATSVGSVLQQPAGWLVGFEDISSADLAASRVAKAAQVAGNAPVTESQPLPVVPPPPAPAPTIPPSTSGQGAEQFEQRARTMLGDGQSDVAQEVLAAALCVYPRSRPLRSLYYVASAMAALEKSEVMLAMSQLETALAHYEQCVEAAQILEHVRRHGTSRSDEMRRLFR